jgi:hypothetical protein
MEKLVVCVFSSPLLFQLMFKSIIQLLWRLLFGILCVPGLGFYGPSYYPKWHKAWTNLCALLESIEGAWLCCGDFNCIIEVKEKLGGRRGSSLAPNYLRNLLFNLDVVDLGFSGAKFTWYNKR